jgi:Membrane transport protein MerF
MKLPRRRRVATAQTPVHKGVGHYGPPITLNQTKKAMAAAEALDRRQRRLATIGISGSMGWLDYVLLPLMAIFAGLVLYAVINSKLRGRVSISK